MTNQFPDTTDVLDKVKKVPLMPGINMITVEQVADYYEVDEEAISSCYRRHKKEIDSCGAKKFGVKDLIQRLSNDFETRRTQQYTDFQLSNDITLRVPNAGIRLFPKKAILCIGMNLTDSKIAKEVRKRMLNTFSNYEDNTAMNAKNVDEKLLDAEARRKFAGRVEVLDKVKRLFLFCDMRSSLI